MLSQKERNFPPRMSLYSVSMIMSGKCTAHASFATSVLSDFRWFAVRCRRGMEIIVDFKLRTMLIETLFPLAKQSDGQPRCTSRDLSRPLFAGYLFANFRAAASLRAVAVSRGVLRVVSKNGAPLPVNESIITSLRQRVGPDGLIDLCESSTIPRNDLQAVPDPMEAWLSVFQPQLSDERRVEILVQILKGCPELRLNPEEKPMRSRAVPQRNSREGAICAFPKTAPTV
jgi:transcription antitermination factor NusG